jgi:PAS domain S-box-containing protein
VAEGDFSRAVVINTRDELKDLGGAFNNMVRQLKIYSDMQAERTVREQKNTEAIFFSIDAGIVMVDDASRVQLANRKARSVMGVSPDAVIEGRPLPEVIENADIRSVVCEALSSRKENFVKEIEVLLEHSNRFFRCVSAPITEPDKVARLGTLVAFYDITLDKELERIKEEFLHSITHDLRNPMGAVKGFVEFLLKEIPGPVNEAQRKMLVSIDRASFRLLGMINNILDIAKMEAGKLELRLTSVNVRETAAGVLELLESLGHRKNIKFVLDAAGPITVTADGPLLERVFINIVGNAAKFSPENGIITLHLEEDGEKLTAYVSDEGEGVPLEYIDRIFEKFEQVQGQRAGGTGLGLTICRHIVTAHLGRIWVESEPGKGAKFLFTVPKGLRKNENDLVCL